MNRLTETNFEKEMRIGFDLMDRHINDGIKKLDAMKAEYEAKLQPKPSKMVDDIIAIFAKMQNQACQGLIMSEKNYSALQQMPISFDRGQNDMSVAAQWSMGRFGQAMPVYRSPIIGLGDIA